MAKLRIKTRVSQKKKFKKQKKVNKDSGWYKTKRFFRRNGQKIIIVTILVIIVISMLVLPIVSVLSFF